MNTSYNFDPKLFAQFMQFVAMQEQIEKDKKAKKVNPKRRIKGTGGITRLSGNRRRPFMVSITGDANPLYGNKKQIPLAYFSDKNDASKFLDLLNMEREGVIEENTAYNFLFSVNGTLPRSNDSTMEYIPKPLQNLVNKTVDNTSIPTVKEIWHKLLASDIKEMSKNTQSGYKYAFQNLESIHDMPINLIKLQHLQPIFDDLKEKGYSYAKMNQIKNVLNHIFNYAEKYDLIEKNYTKFITYRDGRTDEQKEEKKKVPFSKELIKTLFENDDQPENQSILIMIYTGMCPSEMLQLKPENIHLEERYMIGGLKTSNGIDRIIPIHECIVPYVKELTGNGVLGLSYHYYVKLFFNKAREKFGFTCTPHSGRHTFATLANEYELNEFLIKKIMGHSAKDLTKDVYTHVEAQRLIEKINKLPVFK